MEQSGIVRVFDGVDLAEEARRALLEAGFAPDAVVLSVRIDEAGPVEGNFAVGNTPVESDAHVYNSNYHPVERGHCVLMVQASSAAMAERAAALLAAFGARDPDPLAG